MNKSEIRKKILKIRKQNNFKNSKIRFKKIQEFFKKKKIKGKIVGGYYPYNYELDITEILNDLEKYNFIISLPKIKKNFEMDFFDWSLKEPLTNVFPDLGIILQNLFETLQDIKLFIIDLN